MMKQTSRRTGFTLVEIMIVVAIIGLLAAIAIPNFVRARQSSQTNACINNLRQIDAAKQQWALEQGQSAGAVPVSADIENYVGRAGLATKGKDICCPLVKPAVALGGYTIGAVSTLPICAKYDAKQSAGGTHYASLDPDSQ